MKRNHITLISIDKKYKSLKINRKDNSKFCLINVKTNNRDS